MVRAAIAYPRHARAAGRIEGAFCRGIVSFGNGPRHVSPDIVDYAKGGIFSRPRPSFDRRSGSASAWEAAQADMGEVPSAVVACVLQRVAEINSVGDYLRGLTRKSEFGDFSLGPILMAQIIRGGETKRA